MLIVATEEAKRINANRVHSFPSKAAEKALSCMLLAGNGIIHDELKTSSYCFVIHILAEMAATSGLDNIFNRDIERWAQILTFIEAFLRHTLTSLQFVHPTVKSIKQNLKEYKQAIKPDIQQIGSPASFQIPSASSFNFSVEYKHSTHR